VRVMEFTAATAGWVGIVAADLYGKGDDAAVVVLLKQD
jgi:hypothetical protein